MSKTSRYFLNGFAALTLFVLVGCGAEGLVAGISNGTSADAAPPTVSSSNPASGATSVPLNSTIAVTFSKVMNASTITTAAFTLSNGVVATTGSVVYNGATKTATFTPASNLSNNMTYTATVTTGVKDFAGNAMASSYFWSFTTGAVINGVAFAIPDTGQTGDYTATFGEDSDYTMNAMSFTNNLDGTTTDNVTSLMWQQQDDGNKYTWSNAVNYCANLSLGGQTDWRLPNGSELINIVNFGASSPAINTAFFPNTQLYFYWSSVAFAGNTSYAWLFNFIAGDVSLSLKTGNYYARCVRGQPALPPSFTDNGNGTITDNVTGLMWQKQDDGTSKAWDSALNYCEGLTLGGYTNWRLPNAKELSSIADDTKFGPAIDSLFANTQSSYYWSSTTSASGSSNAWGVHFSDGSVVGNGKTFGYYVRCVR